MKKLISLCLILSLLCGFGLTAYAAGDTDPDAAITETDNSTPAGAVVVEMPADTVISQMPATIISPQAVSVQPIKVRMEMVGDVPYITKTYESPQDASINAWMYQISNLGSFEQDGYTFSQYDSYSQIQPANVETRTETKTSTLSIEKDEVSLVLAAADSVISYDEGGFTGQLKLVGDSIVITESGRESYGYRVTDVREYKNLDRQDAAYIPKTVTKNGVELSLENVEWTVMGATPTADGPVANLFKAVATYTGGSTGSRASGYTATFRYEGTVSRETAGSTYINVVFRGEKIVIAEPEPKSSVPLLPILATTLCVIAVLAIAAVAFITRGKWGKVLVRGMHDSTREISVGKIRQAAEFGYTDSQDDLGIDSEPDLFADEYDTQEENDGEYGQDDGYSDYAGEGHFYGDYEDEDE